MGDAGRFGDEAYSDMSFPIDSVDDFEIVSEADEAWGGGRSNANSRPSAARGLTDSSSVWIHQDEGKMSLNSVADMPVFVDSSADLDTVDDWDKVDGRRYPSPTDSDFIVVTYDSSSQGQIRIERLPAAERLKLLKPEVRLRYQQVCTVLRRQHLRSRLMSRSCRRRPPPARRWSRTCGPVRL